MIGWGLGKQYIIMWVKVVKSVYKLNYNQYPLIIIIIKVIIIISDGKINYQYDEIEDYVEQIW